MKFEHKVQVNAEKEKVKAFLNDFPQAARLLPGVEDVKQLGEDTYEGKYRLRLGPLGFSFAGQAKLKPQADPDLWQLELEGRDPRIGAGAKGSMDARFVELGPSSTEVNVVADVTFSGRLAELGQPLIRRKADAMVKDFAENLRKALAS